MKKGCLVAGAVFLGVLSVALGYYFYQQSKKDPVVHEFVAPEVSDIVKKTVATGSIKPRQEVNIKPQVSGIVEEIYVEEGELVSKGQEVAKIKLVPSPVSINSAESQVELARIRYQEAERELARQKEVFDKSLDVQEAAVSYENAKKEEQRQRVLLEDGVISEQEYNRFQLDLDIRQAAYENARIVAQSNLKRFESDLDIRRQELNSAITNLQLLREGASRKYRQLSNVIVSTVAGMVLDVPVEEGSSVIERNNFNEGTSIAVIADMNSLVFEGKVDESEVGKLREGMLLELTVGAIEEDTFEAVLEHISPQGVLEEGTVKFEIKAAVKPAEHVLLRAGYSASGDIILDRRDQVLSILERDVLFENDSTFIEVQTGDQEYIRKPVRTGLSDGIRIEILQGLSDTEKVRMQKKI